MKNRDETEAGIRISYVAEMQEMYRFTEGEFLKFDEVVPMRLNKEMTTVSPKLYFLLMTICGQVESVVIRICEDLGIIHKSKSAFFTCYQKLHENSDVVKRQSVQVAPTREIIKPFIHAKGDPPLWWTSYNKVKHTIPEGIEHATVENTLHALGGLHLLLNLYKSIPYRHPIGIFDTQNWIHDRTMPAQLSSRIGWLSCVPDKDYKSDLFILKSHFMPSDE